MSAYTPTSSLKKNHFSNEVLRPLHALPLPLHHRDQTLNSA